jgi:imidazolonepropionase-like amidohydrolase
LKADTHRWKKSTRFTEKGKHYMYRVHEHSFHAHLALCIVFFSCAHLLQAQTPPAEGIRKNTPEVHAFVNARIVQSPGKQIEKGALVIRNGVVESVGSSPIPRDARVWDMTGMTLYPGLIDSYSDYGMPTPPQSGSGEQQPQPARPAEARGTGHWNSTVLADRRATGLFSPDPKTAEKMRGQGLTSALVIPTRGVFKGMSALVNLGDGKANDQIVRSDVAQHISFDLEPGREGYPGSFMGAIALVRQTLLDAIWYRRAHEVYEKKPTLPRPEANQPLAALEEALRHKTPVIMEASDELDILRARKIAQEFSFHLIVRGSGHEYKRLEAVKGAGAPIILPVNFPEPPSVETPEEALQVSLSELRHWDEVPENPKRLEEGMVPIALTSANLKDVGKFLALVRRAVERGFSRDAALAALTTTPARLFGVEERLGTLEPGKLANFVVTTGDLFSEKTVVRETWIDGRRYQVRPLPDVDPRGKWTLGLSGPFGADTLLLNLKGEPDALLGAVSKKQEVRLSTASLSDFRLSITFTGDSIGYPGVVRMSANVSENSLTGSGELPDGRSFGLSAARTAPFTADPDTATPAPPVRALFPPVYPHGEFGREKLPAQPSAVVVQGATIWTCGPQGKLSNADMLIEKGIIRKAGFNLQVPEGAVVIDGRGKHVTPGLIDAHSHMAVQGAVNEAEQAISAEVRVGDVIDCNDISVYRALAGGLTTAHILHGSANPIGGQCQLIKLRWGMLPDEMKFEDAPPTIKFALGENVKQSNWGDSYTSRYPQTRMGVEQLMRDEFRAALDYERAWERFNRDRSGIPPRQDLELDAILEIIRGRRLIHCHSYRQDEILMMMRVAEDFGVKVRVFQHILEGYKVADVMAKHGAGGSSFSDWWAYKLEVYDAIPYNGALMYEQDVLVSFNSDSDELARRLNLEAAKAGKYGGVPEEDALRFVTLNPARQLKVDNRVGSLEPGKDADFVVWSGNPLSAYSVCEQTWIDGRRFFDRTEDRQLNEQIAYQRSALVQRILTTRKASGYEASQKPQKEG